MNDGCPFLSQSVVLYDVSEVRLVVVVVVCFTSFPWGHYVWTSTSDSLVLNIALEPKESNLSPCVTVGITPKDEFWTKTWSLRPMRPYVYNDHIKADTACLILSHRPSSFWGFDYILYIILISLRYLNTALHIVSSTLAGVNNNVCMLMLLMPNFAGSDSNCVLSDLYSQRIHVQSFQVCCSAHSFYHCQICKLLGCSFSIWVLNSIYLVVCFCCRFVIL